MILMFFLACGSGQDSGLATMPIEVISCAHPDSMFEAAVSVEVEDSVTWGSINFQIDQGDRVWSTNLQTDNRLTWWTHMQLYELDCLSDFEFKINYEEERK